MTVQEIVAEYLKNNGYDGLCNEDCGCGLEDFMPCVNSQLSVCETHGCEPAYRIELGSTECAGWDCEEIKCDGMAYCYRPSKLPNTEEKLIPKPHEIAQLFSTLPGEIEINYLRYYLYVTKDDNLKTRRVTYRAGYGRKGEQNEHDVIFSSACCGGDSYLDKTNKTLWHALKGLMNWVEGGFKQ